MYLYSMATSVSESMFLHTCHILPPSEIDLGLFLVVLQAQKGRSYFTELAERVEYGNYGVGGAFHALNFQCAQLDLL